VVAAGASVAAGAVVGAGAAGVAAPPHAASSMVRMARRLMIDHRLIRIVSSVVVVG
jgi:hypothetical protein